MGRFGWTHFGVMLPSLPEPHRYLGLMVIAGETGQQAFDVEGEDSPDDPLNPVTVAASTASTGAYTRQVLSAREDCSFADGHLRFGAVAEIVGIHPNFEVSVRAGDVTVELEMTCRPEATWFIKSPIYDHLGFMAQYRGQISTPGGRTRAIDGIGNLEYARCMSPAAWLRKSLPRTLPVDSFTYHVVDLPDSRQILFADITAAGVPVEAMLFYRHFTPSPAEAAVGGAEFRVVEFDAEPVVDSGGRQSQVPKSFEFASTELGIRVQGTYDCPQRFGVGVGYISGYRAVVHIGSETFQTRGYGEYVSARDDQFHAPEQ